MSRESLQRAAEAWERSRDDPVRYVLLRQHKRKRVFRFESGLADAPSIIIKTWAVARGSRLSRVKRGLFTAARDCEKEFRIARHLEDTTPTLRVPHAITQFQRRDVLGEHCEVLLMEDLGPCETLTSLVSTQSDDEDLRLRVENFAVDSARALLLDARVIDEDHSTVNMVRAARTGEFHRIDFELALPWDRCVSPARAIGGMLGRLTMSYAFASQPDVVPIERLVRRLVAELSGHVPNAAWAIAYSQATKALERQHLSHGIDMRPDLSALAEAGQTR